MSSIAIIVNIITINKTFSQETERKCCVTRGVEKGKLLGVKHACHTQEGQGMLLRPCQGQGTYHFRHLYIEQQFSGLCQHVDFAVIYDIIHVHAVESDLMTIRHSIGTDFLARLSATSLHFSPAFFLQLMPGFMCTNVNQYQWFTEFWTFHPCKFMLFDLFQQ